MNNQPPYANFMAHTFGGAHRHSQTQPPTAHSAHSRAGHIVQHQPRVSGRKRTSARSNDDDDSDEDYSEDSNSDDDDDTEEDSAYSAEAASEPADEEIQQLPTSNKRSKKTTGASPNAVAARKAPKVKKEKGAPVIRTPAQLAAAALKAEKKSSFPELDHSVLIDRMPLALKAPLDPTSSNGWMEAIDYDEVQSRGLPVDAVNARVLVRVNVSRMLFDVDYQGTSGGRHYATQRVLINGVEVGTIDRDFLALSSFQNRAKQQWLQAEKRKGPAKKRSNQADRQPAEFVVREFERVTIVSAAPNAFSEGTRTKFPSQNVAQFGPTQVSQQGVGKGKPVATYFYLYVDRADINASITFERMRSQCGEHRSCVAHDACQFKIGYKATDVMRAINAQGEWVEQSIDSYDLAVIAKPTKLTTDNTNTQAAIRAAAVAAAQAAAAASVVVPPAAPRAPRIKYTTASKKAATAAATKASRLAVWAAAYAANNAAAAVVAQTSAEVAFVPAPVHQVSPPSTPIGPGFNGALNSVDVTRSTSPCSPQSVFEINSSAVTSPKLFFEQSHEQAFGTTFIDATTDLSMLDQSLGSPVSPHMHDTLSLSPDTPLAAETQLISDSLLGLGEGDASPSCGSHGHLMMLPPAAAAGLPLTPSLLLPLSSPRLQLQSSDSSYSALLPSLPTLSSSLPLSSPLSHLNLAPFVNFGQFNAQHTHITHNINNAGQAEFNIQDDSNDIEGMMQHEFSNNVLLASGILGGYD